MQCVRAAVQVATTIPVLVVIDECLFSLCRVPDRSMMPTLQDDVDSLVFVDKFNLRRWLSSNVWDSQLRGEVVYLNSPSDPDTFLMKRVIGLPGDWISVPSEQELIHIPKVANFPVPKTICGSQCFSSSSSSFFLSFFCSSFAEAFVSSFFLFCVFLLLYLGTVLGRR